MKSKMLLCFLSLFMAALPAIGQRKDLCQPGSDHAHRHAGEHQDGGYFHHEDCRQPVYRQHCPYKTVLWKRLPYRRQATGTTSYWAR